MAQVDSLHIAGLPGPLRWHGTPQHWNLDNHDLLTIAAGERTDWFLDPEGTYSVHNAPSLLFQVEAPCSLSTRVTVNPAKTYDAGALVIYQDEQVWAKLCLELSPQGQLNIVSVVTKGVSDDCNSLVVEGQTAYLRVVKLERAYAFHYSPDAVTWNLIRYFTLSEAYPSPCELGFLVQSPLGNGNTAHFSNMKYVPRKISDIRSGE